MVGVETAKRLLQKSDAQQGLFTLYDLGLLRESVEASVINEKFQSLFTKDEIEEARRRLEELGYFDTITLPSVGEAITEK